MATNKKSKTYEVRVFDFAMGSTVVVQVEAFSKAEAKRSVSSGKVLSVTEVAKLP